MTRGDSKSTLEVAGARRQVDPQRTYEARLLTLIDAAPEAIVVLDVQAGCFVDCNHHGFFIIDARWRLLSINPSAARLQEVDAAAVLHRDLREVFAAAPGSPWEGALRSAISSRLPHDVEGCQAPHGRWHEARIQLHLEGAAVFFSDISVRKRAEQSIRESEQRFRSLVENIESIAVQGYDAQRRITFWNRASELLYGYPAAEVLGRTLEDTIFPRPCAAWWRPTSIAGSPMARYRSTPSNWS